MFGKLFTTALLATAVAGANVRRDAPTILKAFTDIGAGIEKLTNGFNSWDGKAESAVPFLDDAKALQTTIASSTAAIKASPPLGLIDSIQILGPSNDLNAKVDGIVNAIISKKPQFDAAGLTSVVAQQIEDQAASSKELASSIIASLPSLAQSIGGPLASQITGKLQKIIDVFEGKAPAADASAPAADAAAPVAPAAPAA